MIMLHIESVICISSVLHMHSQIVAEDLERSYQQFEELRECLAGIATDYEHMLEMVETVNAICDEMEALMLQIQRAQLMSIYYDLVRWEEDTATGEVGATRLVMTERDFQRRFLSRLDKELRTQLKERGGFSRVDRDGDGTIDKDEFIMMINEILDETQDVEERHLETLGKLNYN